MITACLLNIVEGTRACPSVAVIDGTYLGTVRGSHCDMKRESRTIMSHDSPRGRQVENLDWWPAWLLINLETPSGDLIKRKWVADWQRATSQSQLWMGISLVFKPQAIARTEAGAAGSVNSAAGSFSGRITLRRLRTSLSPKTFGTFPTLWISWILRRPESGLLQHVNPASCAMTDDRRKPVVLLL